MSDDLPKNLPIKEIYKDIGQPAAREIGKALENTVKAGRFLLAPVEYVAAWRGRWERYLKRISTQVTEKNLVEADPEIAGPIFMNLIHAKEDGLLAEMFLNLLARSIDRERASEAHPAFGHIVGQLHPDEALVLFHLKKKWYSYVQRSELDRATNTFGARILVSNDFPVVELAFPENFGFYMDHLYHSSLAWIRQIGNQETLYEGSPGVQTGVRIMSSVELMGFGQKFATACVPDEIPTRM